MKKHLLVQHEFYTFSHLLLGNIHDDCPDRRFNMNSILSFIFLGIYMMIALTEAGEVECPFDCQAELKRKHIALTYESMQKCNQEHCKCRYMCYKTHYGKITMDDYKKCAAGCP
ncbi:Hypothetical predicted protein [Octopus vulgaris]|uniref:Uncharacterized protein n=1 Tax=Octopus vulgaris TaxID=6645 RepID=A0AA36F1J9_OCTVU|nr:Hypothetical predicted protein [Octopus vulgaris]